MSSKDIVLVLGYGRSGTSALTRVISLCGCNLPQSVFGATEINPTGHWEPVDATNLNIEFVSQHGLANDPSMRLQEIEIGASEKESYIQRVQALLSRISQGPAVIKEWRINELFDFWVEAARREGFSVKVVIAIRHPQEVLESITAARPLESTQTAGRTSESSPTAQMVPVEEVNAFWLRTNLLAERHSRGLPRVFVEYCNLVKDWRAEVTRISNALSIDLKVNEIAIDGFLTNKLYRQRYTGPVTETFSYSWTTRVYAILSAAAQDAPIDYPSLDEIFHGYRVNARTFRIAMGKTQGVSSAQRLRDFVDRIPVWNAGRDY